MKKFNLEAAKAGAKVVTRDGKSVRILATDRLNKLNYSVVGLILDKNGEESLAVWTKKGEYHAGETSTSDLFMAPVKKEGYTIIYPPEHWRMKSVIAENGLIFETLEDAELQRGPRSHLPIAKVEWEE